MNDKIINASNGEKKEKLVLIDGHSILNRAFYGMPDLTNGAGQHTGAVYGFLAIMFRILDEEKPDYLTVAFDVHAPTFRHKVYPEYKGTRHPMPDELREQVPLMKEVLHSMDIATCERAGLEADDILGTLAKKSQAEGMDVVLVSGDRDLLQIADEHIEIRIPKTKKGQTTVENYYAEDVKEALQVTPSEFIQVKALQGDTADNIPGVPKVGPKTATELIVKYHSVDGVYHHLDEITKKGLHNTLEDHKDLAELSLFLATIKTDCDIELDKKTARITNFYTPEAYRLFTELGFRNYLGRFDKDAIEAGRNTRGLSGTEKPSGEEQENAAYIRTIVTRQEDASAIFRKLSAGDDLQDKWIGVCPVFDTPGLRLPDRLCGVSVTAGRNTWFFVTKNEPEMEEGQLSLDFGTANRKTDDPEKAYGQEDAGDITTDDLVSQLSGLRKGIEGQDSCLAVFDIKSQYPFWGISEDEFQERIQVDVFFDVLIGAYLVNPLKNDFQPEDVASLYLGDTIRGRRQLLDKSTFEEVIRRKDVSASAPRDHSEGSGQNSWKLPSGDFAGNICSGMSDVADYAADISETLQQEAPLVQAKLKEEGMWDLYRKVELPLSYILYDMQRIGIRVVPSKLKDYGDQLVGRIGELEAEIYEEAGHEFNIASPKQLGQVLFEEMHLPNGKKTKSGFSTAADVLDKLAPDYKIVADVLEYRGLTKLKSTYADGLQAFIAADSRIHTTFHQTITATGRISSTDPNLQNIPMRTDLGRAIRKVFIPQDGWCFTDADYSQIELRILASMSGDEALIEAYRENRDIHRTTASKVFHVPFDEVTPLQRRNAKAVNFGIVYGISSFGLSQNLSISRKEAAEYIDEYFRMFPGIKVFLDKEVSDAKARGYSVTMFGRRRPIPELKNSNYMQRQFGERVAMNAPIQGTGADIMKIAMIRVWESLHRQNLKSKLILQIHDELLIETAPGEEEAVAAILKDGMMGAATLKVPLEIDCHAGSDWYEAK